MVCLLDAEGRVLALIDRTPSFGEESTPFFGFCQGLATRPSPSAFSAMLGSEQYCVLDAFKVFTHRLVREEFVSEKDDRTSYRTIARE
ncbi:hypothetical protein [Microcoleus sp. CAWBG58]|uniref:hypothetical protein n=1 Tax=Microcoleus sp. CAWBG58 TaxID=2841651 RepID=UPI0025D1A786|nr:hypothetical protein [Microcoleus sp. CAWBG58]